MPRTVTLVLLDAAGALHGALPPFDVDRPWWPEATDVVDGARRRHGVDVVVLRLLHARWPMTEAGQPVTYLAECTGDVPAGLAPYDVDLSPHPLRAPWAEPGGPAASLAWARGVLGPVTATQVRSWNLSSIWRLEHAGGTAWLKEVPAFMAHEGALLRWLDVEHPGFAAAPLAVDGARTLMAQIEGEDHYRGPVDVRVAALERLHRVQRHSAAGVEELLALGVPDWRTPMLAARIRATVIAYDGPPAILADLDDRLDAIAACGLPDTLVHGDYHPGNVRGATALDWGDSVIGHPAFDACGMVRDLPQEATGPVLRPWCAWWREAVPGCDPERALALLEPLNALRGAVVYANFLARIEPDEHPYHSGDVGLAIDSAAALIAPVPAGH